MFFKTLFSNLKQYILSSRASYNYEQIFNDTQCGCFYCLNVFKGCDINKWIDGNKTALCPFCLVDSVVPNCTDKIALKNAHEFWFKR